MFHVIKVYSGTYDDILYPDSIVVNKPVTLEGISEEYGEGIDEGKPVIDGYNGAILTISDTDFVVVTGFQIGSLRIIRSNNITISYNLFNSRRDHGGEEGISIVGGRDILIYKNSLRNHGHALSIYVDSNSNIEVLENNFINNVRHAKFKVFSWYDVDTSADGTILFKDNFYGSDLPLWAEDHSDSWERFKIPNLLFYYIICKRVDYNTLSLSKKCIFGKVQPFYQGSSIDFSYPMIFFDENPQANPINIDMEV